MANRQGAVWLHHVDLYSLWTRGQMEKCKFWQLLLWALTSRDSFSPKPHPGSDFPTSAIIYWQELFLFLRLKELPSTNLSKVLHRSKRWTESSFPCTASPAQGNISPFIISQFWRRWQHKSFPIVPLSAWNKGKSPSPSLDPVRQLRPQALFHGAASQLFWDKHFQYYMRLA